MFFKEKWGFVLCPPLLVIWKSNMAFFRGIWVGCIFCSIDIHDICLHLSWVMGHERNQRRCYPGKKKKKHRCNWCNCPVCQLQMLRQISILTTSFKAAKQMCALWESLASSRVFSHHPWENVLYFTLCTGDRNNTVYVVQYAALGFGSTSQLSLGKTPSL